MFGVFFVCCFWGVEGGGAMFNEVYEMTAACVSRHEATLIVLANEVNPFKYVLIVSM
jgi:hypothetical protein